MILELLGSENKNSHLDNNSTVILEDFYQFRLHADTINNFNVTNVTNFIRNGLFSYNFIEKSISKNFSKEINLYFKEIENELETIEKNVNFDANFSSVKNLFIENPYLCIKLKLPIQRIVSMNCIIQLFKNSDTESFLNKLFNLHNNTSIKPLKHLIDSILSNYINYTISILLELSENRKTLSELITNKKNVIFFISSKNILDFNETIWNSSLIYTYIPKFLERFSDEYLVCIKYLNLLKDTEKSLEELNIISDLKNLIKFNDFSKIEEFEVLICKLKSVLINKCKYFARKELVDFLEKIKKNYFFTQKNDFDYELKIEKDTIFRVYEQIFGVNIIENEHAANEFYFRGLLPEIPKSLEIFFSEKNIGELKLVFRFIYCLKNCLDDVNNEIINVRKDKKLQSEYILRFSLKNFFSVIFFHLVSSLNEYKISEKDLGSLSNNFFENSVRKSYLSCTGFMKNVFKIMNLSSVYQRKVSNISDIVEIERVSKNYLKEFYKYIGQLKEEVEVDGRDVDLWGILEHLNRNNPYNNIYK